MRVAISTDGDYVSPHFGRCPSFTIVDIEDGKIIKKKAIQNPGINQDLSLNSCISMGLIISSVAEWGPVPKDFLMNLGFR